ncbi:MAG: MOSC domain-containing protein [Micromonosporaceae bacterium]
MRIGALYTYPVKGCYRLEHDSVRVEPWGLAGDRRWLVVDPDGTAVTQRDVAGLGQIRPTPTAGGLIVRAAGRPDLTVPEPRDGEPTEVTVWGDVVRAASAGAVADDWFSEALDRKVRLVWLDDPTRRAVDPRYGLATDRVSFADGYPLLLANAASLDALNDWLAEDGSPEWPLPMTRFRPNVVVTGAPAWAEDDWVGGRIRIGEVTFRVPKACGRCVVTTTDQETGERGREPLRTLARYRNVDQKLLFAVNLIPDAPGHIRVGDPVHASTTPPTAAR